MSSDQQTIYGLGDLMNPAYTIPDAAAIERQTWQDPAATSSSSAAQQPSPRELLAKKMAEIESRVGFHVFDDTRQPAHETSRAGVDDGPEPERETSRADGDDEHAFEDYGARDHAATQSYDQADAVQGSAPSARAPAQSTAGAGDFARALPLSNEGMRFTDEERKRDRVISAMSALQIGVDGFLDSDREYDTKVAAIEEIEDLVALFKDNGEDMSRIHVPTVNDSLDVIQSTLKFLNRHNDRRRFGSVADDCVMMAASGLEYLFDGNRSFFGFRPNLTGWHSHVRTKLRRMRHDTSQIASSLMNDYNFGPISRFAIELIPSMVMYAGQHSSSGDQAPQEQADFDSAVDRLRDK